MEDDTDPTEAEIRLTALHAALAFYDGRPEATAKHVMDAAEGFRAFLSPSHSSH